MIELIIKNPDGSIYWRDWFESLDACNCWLAIECTRSYWNSKFNVTKTVIPLVRPPDEPAKSEQKKQRTALLAPLVAKAVAGKLTNSDATDAVQLILLDLYT